MSVKSSTSFLDLPAELRFKVYHFINEMNDVPMSAFKGLYLSCHQTKEEMDTECIERIRRTITQAWDHESSSCILEISKTFAKARAAKITIPAAAVSSASGNDLLIVKCLASLPLDAIILSLQHQDDHDDLARRRVNRDFHWYMCLAGVYREDLNRSLRIGKLVFEDAAYMRTDDYVDEWEPCVGVSRVAGWADIVEYEYLVGQNYPTLQRITRARLTDIERWEKQWLEGRVVSWV